MTPLSGKAFAASVARARAEKGWSQRELAKRLMEDSGGERTFHQPTVQRIESGERPIRIDEMLALSRVLGLSIREALTSSIQDGSAEQRAHEKQVADDMVAAVIASHDRVRRAPAGSGGGRHRPRPGPQGARRRDRAGATPVTGHHTARGPPPRP